MKLWACLAIGIVGGILWSKQAPDKTPIIQSRLTNVVLSTTNMDKEVQFFEETLGFKAFYRDKTSCFLKTASANLVLVKVGSSKAVSRNFCLDVNVPSLADAQKALSEAKLKVDATDPAILKIKDPDGNLIEIVKG